MNINDSFCLKQRAMEAILAKTNVWIDKAVYDEAERIYLERIANVRY